MLWVFVTLPGTNVLEKGRNKTERTPKYHLQITVFKDVLLMLSVLLILCYLSLCYLVSIYSASAWTVTMVWSHRVCKNQLVLIMVLEFPASHLRKRHLPLFVLLLHGAYNVSLHFKGWKVKWFKLLLNTESDTTIMHLTLNLKY